MKSYSLHVHCCQKGALNEEGRGIIASGTYESDEKAIIDLASKLIDLLNRCDKLSWSIMRDTDEIAGSTYD